MEEQESREVVSAAAGTRTLANTAEPFWIVTTRSAASVLRKRSARIGPFTLLVLMTVAVVDSA